MVARFDDESLEAALDRSLQNAKHLRAIHAGTVKAARLLARKIDAWDQIVAWALEDIEGVKGGRPAVPANDNVSVASFLKYMDTLGLTPPAVAKAAPAAPAPKVETPEDEVAAMRKQMQSG